MSDLPDWLAAMRRPAWEALSNQRPARPGLNRGGHGAAPYQRPAMRAMATRDIERSLGGGESSRNQLENTAQGALVELTGLPSVRRSARAFASGDPATGLVEGGLGMLGVAGMAAGVPRGRPVPRLAESPPARLPANPARPLGRASDGSVMPIAPRQPFRNSLRGGSDDLREALDRVRSEVRRPLVSPQDRARAIAEERDAITREAAFPGLNRGKQLLLSSKDVARQQVQQDWQTSQTTQRVDPQTGWPLDPVTGEPVAPLEWERRQIEAERQRQEDERRAQEGTQWAPSGRGVRISRRF